MSNEWFYSINGAQNGPVELEALKTMQAAGQFAADSLFWREGMAEWKPWQEVPELAGSPSLVTGAASSSGGGIYAPPGANALGQTASPHLRPPNYLWQSIVCTVMCCWPFGVVGIVYAAKVNGLYDTGNVPAALEASQKAKFWCWLSFGCFVGLILLYILLIAAGGMSA